MMRTAWRFSKRIGAASRTLRTLIRLHFRALTGAHHGMRNGRDLNGSVEPLVLTAWNDGELAGLLPLQVETRFLIIREIRPLSHPHCQYAGILLNPDFDVRHVLDAFRTWIDYHAPGDVIVLDAMADKSALRALSGAETGMVHDGKSYVLDLRAFESFGAYETSLSRNTRKGLGRKRRKLEQAGGRRVRLCRTARHRVRTACFPAVRLETRRPGPVRPYRRGHGLRTS